MLAPLVVGCLVLAGAGMAFHLARQATTLPLRLPVPAPLSARRADGLGEAVRKRWTSYRSARQADAGLAGLADAVSASLGAGSSLPQAISDASAVAGGLLEEELRAVERRLDAGRTFVDAMGTWERAATSEGARMVVAVCAVSVEVGGPSAESFQRCADLLRKRRRLEIEVRGASAQAKASAVMLGCLPFAAGLFMSALDPQVGRLLFFSPVGWILIAAGLFLDLCGIRWMMSMVRRVV